MSENQVLQASISTANFLETEEFDLFTESIEKLATASEPAKPETECQPKLTLVRGELDELMDDVAECDDASGGITSQMVENGHLFDTTDADQSAVEDIVLSNPLAEEEEKAALERIASNIDVTPTTATFEPESASATSASRVATPRLNSERLSWKPGDPFGGRSHSAIRNFRWEVMLTAASITALCGLGCIWLLRSILA